MKRVIFLITLSLSSSLFASQNKLNSVPLRLLKLNSSISFAITHNEGLLSEFVELQPGTTYQNGRHVIPFEVDTTKPFCQIAEYSVPPEGHEPAILKNAYERRQQPLYLRTIEGSYTTDISIGYHTKLHFVTKIKKNRDIGDIQDARWSFGDMTFDCFNPSSDSHPNEMTIGKFLEIMSWAVVPVDLQNDVDQTDGKPIDSSIVGKILKMNLSSSKIVGDSSEKMIHFQNGAETDSLDFEEPFCEIFYSNPGIAESMQLPSDFTAAIENASFSYRKEMDGQEFEDIAGADLKRWGMIVPENWDKVRTLSRTSWNFGQTLIARTQSGLGILCTSSQPTNLVTTDLISKVVGKNLKLK